MPCKFICQAEHRELSPVVSARNIKIDGDVNSASMSSCFTDKAVRQKTKKNNGSGTTCLNNFAQKVPNIHCWGKLRC